MALSLENLKKGAPQYLHLKNKKTPYDPPRHKAFLAQTKTLVRPS